jgi:flagellin
MVSKDLDANLNSLEQALRNTNDGFNVLTIMDSAAAEIQECIVRMRLLSAQSANGILASATRATIQVEYTNLISEITRIASVTNFNDLHLLDGTAKDSNGLASGLTLQIGFRNTDTIIFNSTKVTSNRLTANKLLISNGLTAVTTMSSSQSALGLIDSALKSVSLFRGEVGSFQNRLEKTMANLETTIANYYDSISCIRDVDFATETANLVKNQVLAQSGAAALAQANLIPQAVLTLIG